MRVMVVAMKDMAGAGEGEGEGDVAVKTIRRMGMGVELWQHQSDEEKIVMMEEVTSGDTHSSTWHV